MRKALDIEKLKRIYGRVAKRYDLQHAIVTARSDQSGRKILVESCIAEGDKVLDCGSGTGTTGIMAAKKVGPDGRVILFDLSEEMMSVAREKVIQQGLQGRVTFQTGDMVHLPFESNCFDVVLSAYSLCPLYDPKKGAMELYRVTRQGGKIGIAHSAEPKNKFLKWLAALIENLAWRIPWLSMGCRPVNIISSLRDAGGVVIFTKYIGVPLWPFFVFIVEKPASE